MTVEPALEAIRRDALWFEPTPDGLGHLVDIVADSRGGNVIHVETPTQVRMDQAEAGTARGLEIEDQRGERTRIRFRAIPLPEALNGIAPGEI